MFLPMEILDEDCNPYRGNYDDAGWDLRAREGGTMIPGKRTLVPCGIKIALTQGTVGFIKPRSGLAVKHGIDTLAGVIDSNYRGEIHALIINHGWDTFSWNKGDRIAQLVVMRYENVVFTATETIDTDTTRGSAGFGSSGIA
jgi:dUTP pyrophosphatase